MKLYGIAQSRSFRPLWALEESGLEFEFAIIDFTSDQGPLGRFSPEYKQLNLHSKVPTLVDGDLVLTESAAILNYIARKAPAAKLMPMDDPVAQARYDEMAFFVLTELEQPLWSNGKHRFALPEEHRIPRMLECAKFEFAKALDALQRLMGDRQYALGDSFTNADILVAHTLTWAERFKFEVPKKLLAYRDFHYQRPACQRALAKIA